MRSQTSESGCREELRRRGHLEHVLAGLDGEQVVRAERLDDDDGRADRAVARLQSAPGSPRRGSRAAPGGRRARVRPRPAGACRRSGARPASPRSSTTSAARKFIGGVPMKPPTNASAGRRRPRAGVDLDDAAGVHDRDPVAHAERLDLVVRDVDRRRVELLQQRLQLGAHLHPQQRVEVRERLVHQQHVGLRRDRARDRDALPLAAGELGRVAVEQLLDVQQRGGRADALRDRSPCSPSASAGRRRCCRTPSCAGRRRSSGTPSRSGAGAAAGRSRRGRRSARARCRPSPARRGSAAASSCRSPRARAGR